MVNWSVQVVVQGDATVYQYPGGPFLQDYFVTRTANGYYNFHRGRSELDAHKPADVVRVGPLPQHTVTTVEAGATLESITLDHHPWNGDRTLRPIPVALKKTPLDLINLRLVPIFGDTGNAVGNVGYRPVVKPWDKSNVTFYMPTTGERPDIGQYPDVAALALMGGSVLGMVAWFMAMEGCPDHWVDGRTGLPPDILQYPGLNAADFEDLQGVPGKPSPYVIKGHKALPGEYGAGYWMFEDGWEPQPAHYLDARYVYTVMTEDPVGLVHLQQSAVFTLGKSCELWTADGRRVQAGEYRGIGHSIGIMIKAIAATRDAERGGWFDAKIHHPSSHLDQLLANTLEYYLVESQKGCALGFNLINQSSTIGFWQHAYLTINLALGVLTGQTSGAPWAPAMKTLFMHCLKSVVDRYSGKSGWPPAYIAYYVDLFDDSKVQLLDLGKAFDHLYQTEQQNVVNAANQIPPQVYIPAVTKAQYDALKKDGMNGGAIVAGAEYQQTDHAILVLTSYLQKLGYVDASTVPFFAEALANAETLFRRAGTCNPRYSIVDSVAKRFAPARMPALVDLGAAAPPAQPGQPAPPPPNYGSDQPAPNGDPNSVAWEKDAAVNAVTSLDTCYVNVTGKTPPGGLPKVMLNFKGNKRTTLYVQWNDISPNYMKNLPSTPGGMTVMDEEHGSGWQFRFADVAEVIFNGTSIWKSATTVDPTPTPVPEPDPTPAPTPAPVPIPTPGGNMANFPQGTPFTLNLKPDAKNFGVVFTATPAGQLTLAASQAKADGSYDLTVTPIVDTTEEDFSIDAFVRLDPVDPSVGFHKTFSGRDVFKLATAAGTTFSLVSGS